MINLHLFTFLNVPHTSTYRGRLHARLVYVSIELYEELYLFYEDQGVKLSVLLRNLRKPFTSKIRIFKR